MLNIKLLKDPGYMYDLFFIFYLKYNTDYCMESFVNSQKESSNKTFCENIITDFSPISNDLYVFFHALSHGGCFMGQYCFNQCCEEFTTTYSIATIQGRLSDYKNVVKQLIAFYFSSLSVEEVENASNSHDNIFKLIKQSEYSETEKLKLYEFFMDPILYIQTLKNELTAKEFQLAKYYEANYAFIFDAYNGLTVDLLKNQFKPLKNAQILENMEKPLFLSFCLINRECINFVSAKGATVAVLGIEYINGVRAIEHQRSSIKLSDLGFALSETSRIAILDMIYEKGEATCKDLEKAFDFSGSTAYHHLAILVKCGAVKTRANGKTLLYSVNEKTIHSWIKILDHYTKRKDVEL